VAEIKSAIEELTKSSHTLAQKLYEQANKQSGGQAGPGPEAGGPMGGGFEPGQEPPQQQPPSGEKGKGKEGDNIIDAEFETKDKS